MKLLHVLFLLLLITHETASDSGAALFRKKTLDMLNGARRLIASGDIRKILEVFEGIITDPTYRAVLDFFGPATLMYKLVWNRELERVSYNFINKHNSSLESNDSGLLSLKYDGFVGFYWPGDIMAVIDGVLGLLPGNFKDKAKEVFSVIETLIMFLLIAIASPPTGKPVRGETYGAAELLYGERYEIGCTSNMAFAVCMVRKMDYRERFFEIGVSCFKCPGGCEFWMTEDGEYEEGDLCVPPKDFYTKQIADRQNIAEKVMEDGAVLWNSFILSALILVYYLR